MSSDLATLQATIRRRTTWAFGVTLLCFALGFAVLPQFFTYPPQLSARLALGAQAGAFVLAWVLVGVMMVSLARQRAQTDIGGEAFGSPSREVAIRRAFLGNTLEQAILTCGAMLAFASLVEGDALALVPVTVMVFSLGRYLFWRGYPHGAGARAFGMGLTLLPGALLLVFALLATLWNVVMGMPR
ncbi:MAPEG family protein [Pelagibacterium montanilacus]|uniref:MAPEG family protein n=1 Tax=Pelagibacterium montanilacus TaxID=2185280 RepID=UPI000F8EAACC|nr:MAPEG family protein [Pelagibacterium montanilacus]